jgi:hypothetical protein
MPGVSIFSIRSRYIVSLRTLPNAMKLFFALCCGAAGFLLFNPAVVRADTAAKPETPKPESAPAAVVSGPDYVRIAGDETSTRLEVSIATFTLPDGRIVDLFGVVHLGDASYYKDVDQRLAKYDAVLFELVGDPSGLQKPGSPPAADAVPAKPHPLRGLQQGVGNIFKLSFQLEKIDYSRPNFVHADASAEEFAKMQEERGESMMKLLLKSFQLSNDPALMDKLGDANNIGVADLVMLFYSEKTMQRIKVIFAKLLAESEAIMDGGLLEKDNAIIAGRNGVALKKLDEVLTDPAKKRIAIFYGAGHMPTMEQDLKDRLKATRTSEMWLPAWTMPPAPKPKPKAGPDAKPEVKP